MKRRNMLKYLACGLAGFTAGGGLVAGIHWRLASRAPDRITLPQSLSDLADERFLRAMPDVSIDTLLARLEEAEIYSQGYFSVDRIATDSESHQLVEFDGFYYTEPELALYTLIARLQRGEM